MNKGFKFPYNAVTVGCTGLALTSALYLGQTERPFDTVRVAFCPQTSNDGQLFRKSRVDSQKELDRKYCRNEVSMLKNTWTNQQFESSTPLPEATLRIRTIKATQSNLMWFLVAPASFGIAYLSWAKKLEIDENNAHLELEGFKTQVKLTGVSAREERDFKSKETRNQWDAARIKKNHISVKGMEYVRAKEAEMHDKKHASAIKQLELVDSDADKKIAENTRDAAKARKEGEKYSQKHSEQDNQTSESLNKKLINDLTEALKQHESGWLYKVLKMRKPIWILGGQGSGKSTLAASLVLLRYYLFGWELIEIIDAHAQKNIERSWSHLNMFKPIITGARNDYEGIGQSFNDAIERWNDKTEDTTPVQTLVDEYTNYSEAEELKDTAAKFVKYSLSDIRKTGERWIFIAHFFTNTATGGSSGTSKAKNAQTIQIERFTEDGESPLSNVFVTGLTDDKGKPTEADYSIPKWLTPDTIHAHFNGSPIEF